MLNLFASQQRTETPRLALLATFLLIVVACGGGETESDPGSDTVPDLPPISAEEFEAHLESLGKPAVVNVWASWCPPCRSEAPLLDQAFAKYGDEVEFIGVDIQDTQSKAKEFLAEFGLEYDHFFDRDREIPNAYGGIGQPITFFFGPDGELVETHNGVIDERTLALNIEELMAME